MPRPEKVAAVEELKQEIRGGSIAVMTKYQGITVAQVTDLRAKLREQGIKFKVYKNTMAERALNELGLGKAAAYMDGPTAWAFSKDPVAPAKILKQFAKDVKVIEMQGGILEGKPVTGAQLNELANLPSREQLLAQAVGAMAGVARQFLGALSAGPRNLLYALEELKKRKEQQAA